MNAEPPQAGPKERTGIALSPHSPFRSAAVLGAGTMGAQIAAHLANAGLRVLLLDMAAGNGNPNALVEKGFKAARKASPDPFFSEASARRITLGNFDDHFDRLAGVDWIVEAVVERMDVKRDILARIEAAASESAVISTNTSGLPIGELVEGRSEDFKNRFLGTHFFNPPRYLKLLELIPTEDTSPGVVDRVAWFGRVHLGKGIVVAKDSPYFIGNRIGIYGMLPAMQAFDRGEYSIEEIDALTGPLVGRPKSATFRTADLVGLDVLYHVVRNLYDTIPGDDRRDVFQAPAVLESLVKGRALGEKSGAGFYKKQGKTILSIDPATGEYGTGAPPDAASLEPIQKAGSLDDRLKALYREGGRYGRFFRDTTLDWLGYSARRIPEIADSPADIDRAIRWGFGWEKGPFEIWDALGFETVIEGMAERGIETPGWLDTMRREGAGSFYRNEAGDRSVYVPGKGYVTEKSPPDEIRTADIRTHPEKLLWKNDEAALLDLGDGVALYEFRSKANALGRNVMRGLVEVIERVEYDSDLRGLVIGNDGKNFSVGANLGEVAMAAMQGQFDLIERFVARFQQAVGRIRSAAKPVVAAVHGRVLGGGCEMLMACPHPVAAAESYIGLVELGVGLIPAGTGTMRLAVLAAQRSPHGFPSEIQSNLQVYFENVAMAKVAGSAVQARDMGYLSECGPIVMNADRRLYVAREEVIRLSNQGYLPPPPPGPIKVLGSPTRAAFEVALDQYLFGGFISEYDRKLAGRLAYVITGGDLSAPDEVDEQYLVDLEREVFLSLLGEQKTQERITHMLMNGKPLRN